MSEPAVPAEPPRILVSYRRDDTAGYAGHLFDKLTAAFGPGTLFMDIQGITPGADFVEEIKKAVASSHAVIAMIGPNWLNIRDEMGKRRLDDPGDFVRLEIATALQRGILVIPALVRNAQMPREADLPDDLKPLARRQAIEIEDRQFAQDVERLAAIIRQSGAVPALAPTASPPIERTGSGSPPKRLLWRAALIVAAALVVTVVAWQMSTTDGPTGTTDRPVAEPPIVRRFVVEPARFIQGHVDSVRLTWEVDGAADVSLPPLGAVDAKGSRTIPAPKDDTVYGLQARNKLGDTGGRVAVDVLNLDEFISVDAPARETETNMKTWLSEYLRSLAHVGYLPQLLGVVITIEEGLRNAYYDGRNRRIVIGDQLSADRDVVTREYTHLILTGPDFRREAGGDPSASPDGRAIESGLADYLPASANGDPRIGEVSAAFLVKRPFIRNLINNRRFGDETPQDSEQLTGEVWGGSFWDMRLALGRATADPLLLAAWAGMSTSGEARPARRFVDTLIQRAAAADPKHADQIRRIFRDRGFEF